jgi:hypothetical protein
VAESGVRKAGAATEAAIEVFKQSTSAPNNRVSPATAFGCRSRRAT